ncbi:MAG: hypothetical protein JOZ90_16895 [Alphaproteobacteria bacterium]|nr:hypothetical protein [Alphaproteobacteria bacterium]MBV9371509.1 hypothetical protein [Alphaproteobacteria bacterium]MBV9902749.1 hypothetical protein [Alphaproteobacteria bacterium]
MTVKELRTHGSWLALSLALAACNAPGNDAAANGAAANQAAAAEGGNGAAADGNAVYATWGVHNPPGVSNCGAPNCSYAGSPGRPPDPIYPAYWQSRWTMYRVFANYANALPPYKGPPPGLVPGRDYEVSFGATYYDSTWKGPSGEGAMMEHYEKRCLPIFPGIPNTFTCSFISLGDTAYFLTYPQDRPKGMPPVCLFSPLNHPPRRDFITHLPYAPGDSAQLGGGAQAYSFWVGADGKPFQTGVKPDQTANQGILFGYAFAPVNGQMQPQSFYFSGFPLDPPNAPFVSQNYTNWQPTKPDPAKTWAQVSGLDPKQLPACQVMGTPQGEAQAAAALKAGVKRPPSWFDIGEAGKRKH